MSVDVVFNYKADFPEITCWNDHKQKHRKLFLVVLASGLHQIILHARQNFTIIIIGCLGKFTIKQKRGDDYLWLLNTLNSVQQTT